MRLPGASFYRQSPISNNHAKSLFDLWQKTASDGFDIRSDSKLAKSINDLTTAGFIRVSNGKIEFLKRAKDIIRSIILNSEQSALDKDRIKEIDYEALLRKSFVVNKKDTKIASKQNMAQKSNWLTFLVNH